MNTDPPEAAIAAMLVLTTLAVGLVLLIEFVTR